MAVKNEKSGAVDLIIADAKDINDVIKDCLDHPSVDFVFSFGSTKNHDVVDEDGLLGEDWTVVQISKETRMAETMSGDSLVKIDFSSLYLKNSLGCDAYYSAVHTPEDFYDDIYAHLVYKLPDEYINGEPFGVYLIDFDKIENAIESKYYGEDCFDIGAELFTYLKDKGLNFNQIVSNSDIDELGRGFVSRARREGVPIVIYGPSNSEKQFVERGYKPDRIRHIQTKNESAWSCLKENPKPDFSLKSEEKNSRNKGQGRGM